MDILFGSSEACRDFFLLHASFYLNGPGFPQEVAWYTVPQRKDTQIPVFGLADWFTAYIAI